MKPNPFQKVILIMELKSGVVTIKSGNFLRRSLRLKKFKISLQNRSIDRKEKHTI
ncbi:unnamed protein product [marine sediment metagenome]|uniref:Uncharacterized protein n=1 Tax=marine sediment metagenome TaxID=412755 RepID=X1ICH0_9ZZZZ